MVGSMRKYWHVFLVGIQNNLTYRFNFLARTLFGLIPLVATLCLWQTIYRGKGPGASVGSYSLAEMISYYLLMTLVDALTAVNEDDWQIAADIREGNISQFLLKPIDYLWYRLSLFFPAVSPTWPWPRFRWRFSRPVCTNTWCHPWDPPRWVAVWWRSP